MNWLDHINIDSYISIYVNPTETGLILIFISRRYSSKDHNIEEMVFQWMINMM
jgi:hypothetical protein